MYNKLLKLTEDEIGRVENRLLIKKTFFNRKKTFLLEMKLVINL
jgi:hypothetical protein